MKISYSKNVFSRGNMILLFVLLSLSSMMFVIQNVFFDMTKLSCVFFFLISIFFDIIFVGLYPFLRKSIKAQYKSEYLKQTLPFLGLFGGLYPLKISVLYFMGMVSFYQSGGSYLLVLIIIAVFGYFFRRMITIIYKAFK